MTCEQLIVHRNWISLPLFSLKEFYIKDRMVWRVFMRGKWIFGKLKAHSGPRIEDQARRYLLFSLA